MGKQPIDRGAWILPEYDVAIVGAGILGLAVAREFARRSPQSSIVVVEKETTVAAHQTGHNSGVIHSGIYYQPGSLKARLCVEGARLMYEYCVEHAIEHSRCGKLIVAVREDELGRLRDLHERGTANEVPGLRRVGPEEIREIEPNAVGLAALHSPGTGIVDYAEVCRVIHRELAAAGVQFRFGAEVLAIADGVLALADGPIAARRVVVCAGLWADRLARRSGAPADPRVVPFRGSYLRLKPAATPVVRGMVYPVPDPTLPFLGVHVTPHIDGNIMLGPTAMMAPSRDGYLLRTVRGHDVWESLTWPGTWQVARRFWRTGAQEVRLAASKRAFVDAAARYVPSLDVSDLDGSFHAGVRAQAVGRDGTLVDDFVLSQIGAITHVRNAPSPAATSGFALAREIVDRIEAQAQ